MPTAELMRFSALSQSFHGTMPSSGTATTRLTATTSTVRLQRSAQLPAGHMTMAAGHVAVVEKVENGQITFSNSAWSGKNFYLSYASTSDKNAGGNNWWNFQGYILPWRFQRQYKHYSGYNQKGNLHNRYI